MESLTPEEMRERDKEYGVEFISDLVMMFQTRKADYDFLGGLIKVLPMKAMPEVAYMIIPCADCNTVLEASNNGQDALITVAKAFPHKVVVRFGLTERLLSFFSGKCPKCGKRFIVSHVGALKAITYFAIFGDWPEEG